MGAKAIMMRRALVTIMLIISNGAWAAVTVDKACVARGQTRAQVETYIEESAKRYHIDPVLLWAKAKVESGLNPCVISRAGAIGVMQIMPETADDLGLKDSFDAAQNIDGGAKYLSKLIKIFKIPQLYIAAYNAGPNAVLRKRYVPNYKETKRHLRLVLREYKRRRGMEDDYAALRLISEWHKHL